MLLHWHLRRQALRHAESKERLVSSCSAPFAVLFRLPSNAYQLDFPTTASPQSYDSRLPPPHTCTSTLTVGPLLTLATLFLNFQESQNRNYRC